MFDTDPTVLDADATLADVVAARAVAQVVRRSHRIKTHGRWQVRQVFNGVFVWRTPSGRLHLVDDTGTHAIPHTAA